MIPGPKLVYACPNCGEKIIVGSIESGNTFGATLFSDGMQRAPMLPQYPDETKCKKCGTIFGFTEKTFVSEANALYRSSRMKGENLIIHQATFLQVEDYQTKIELNQGSEERNRFLMWHTANGTYGAYGQRSVDTEQYIDNCKKLIEMIKDTDDSNRKITLAELYRNIGDFESCERIISNLEAEFDWVKEPFLDKCREMNIDTFILRGGRGY